jgi:hypothetical protein
MIDIRSALFYNLSALPKIIIAADRRKEPFDAESGDAIGAQRAP